ncbi:pacearchaeosortase [Candidatus Woesearchaeota archaeon]|nr:pacearchaeosortase [Candidatus Woesearchaeota archaeon]
MRYEISLTIRVILALALFIVPLVLGVNIFQKVFEKATFDIVYAFLERSGLNPETGSYSVSYAISILDGEATINIVKYCVTASAYYLMTLLCIITMGVAIWKRALMFIIGMASIFAMNLIRIAILVHTLVTNAGAYDAIHSALNFALSVGYVLFIWAALSFMFHVKTVPFYSDIKFLISEISNKSSATVKAKR